MLGIVHPDYLESVLTVDQLAGWEDYAGIEPFGPPTDDVRLGLIVQSLYQCQPGAKPVLLEKCIPKWGEKEPLTPDEYRSKSMRAYAGHGGEIKNG